MKILLVLTVFMLSMSAFALEVGTAAPNFTLPGLGVKNKDISLSDFKGKIVVLEWLNHGCPFVRKHYDSGNMQALQKKYVEKNVIWLSIISSAPGKQGHVDTSTAIKEKQAYKSASSNVLLDPTGAVGKQYGAKTTPHMFVIAKDGTLAYQGAIDDKADTDKASVPHARNYVAQTIDELMAGKKVSMPSTKAYGCAVKYAE